MADIKKNVLVPYTPAQMFDLVNKIEDYPEFLPWCKATTVYSRSEDEVRASVLIAKSGIQYTFTTLNRLQKDKRIDISLLEGPLRTLEGFWLFEARGEGECQVSFDLKFEFLNKLVSLTVGPILQKVTETFVEAFCNRAKIIYGQKVDQS